MDSLIERTAPWFKTALITAIVLAWNDISAQTIFWSSHANATNLTSAGQPMDQDFRFELGVFTGSFAPTSGNMAQWSANWNPLQRLSYNPSTKRFAGSHSPDDNNSPFTIGRPVFVWGFQGDASAGEWILFRANSWQFPDTNPPFPPPANAYEWYADAPGVTAVIGSIQSSGAPFLMRTASVSGVLPPATTWGQWRADTLAGETLNQQYQDPDADGLCNLLEFVFGLVPLQPGALPVMPLTLERVGGQDYLQIHVPRRKDHVASLSVQVSPDLVQWNEGGSFVQVVDDGVDGLVVRDLTPYSPAGGRRFMRLRVNEASP